MIKDDMKEILDKILNEQLQWRECLGESSVYMHQPYSNACMGHFVCDNKYLDIFPDGYTNLFLSCRYQ